jgi:hypothetical protein
MLSFGFSALVFAVGVLAGQSVHSEPEPSAEGRYNSKSSNAAITDSSPPESEPATFKTVSSQRLANAARSRLEIDSAGAASDLVNETESTMLPDSVSRRNVLQLIRRIFPDADEETANVWADVYADTDPSEVQFILEQKRMLSGTLAVSGSTGLEGSLWKTPKSGSAAARASTPLAVAVDVVRNNLRGAWSIGFRQTIVLPEALPSNETLSFSSLEQIRSTMFLSFDAGRMISSPVATHVALPTDDGSLMFRLEGLRLTRRGDFILLSDRRLGLMTQSENFVLEDSPRIPDDAIAVRITMSGEIQFENSSGEMKSAGTLSVLKVTDLAKLRTRDGVIFTIEDPNPLSFVTPATPELSTLTLEISNVNREDESRLLEQLTSLLPGT